MMHKRDNRDFIVVLTVGGALAYAYFFVGLLPRVDYLYERHLEFFAGTLSTPWRYRVLGYTLIELLSRPLASIAGDRWAFAMAYYTVDVTALAAFLAAFYAWLRRWARREHALMGLLLAAVTMPVVFHQYYYVWSTLSALAYALALMAIQDRRRVLLLIVLVLAALNRETAAFIPLLYVAIQYRREPLKTTLLWGGLYGAVFVVIFVGVRVVLGTGEPMITVPEIARSNLGSVVPSLGVIWLACGALWLFALRGLRAAPELLRRAALVIPPYMLMFAIYALWNEVRLLLPLYPILVPLALGYLFGEQAEPVPERALARLNETGD